jgi:drug/metabolite transporter (DMT)-like permease
VRSYWPLLVLLASVWGASYLFIKVAVDDIPPAAMTDIRLLAGGVLLFGYLAATSGGGRAAVSGLRAAWVPSLVLGFVNAALPMSLVAWGETHIDSSVAAIAQSSVPIFVVLLGLRFLQHEPIGAARSAGLLVGLGGVALVTGVHPGGGWPAVAGTLAVVASSAAYALGAIYGQLQVHGTPGPVLAAGNLLFGALLLVPLTVLDPPRQLPGLAATAGLAGLILLPTVLGQLVMFRMLRLHGSRRGSLVTYLMPAFALLYGSTILDEPITAAALGGLALILAGVALASGERVLGPRMQGEAA